MLLLRRRLLLLFGAAAFRLIAGDGVAIATVLAVTARVTEREGADAAYVAVTVAEAATGVTVAVVLAKIAVAVAVAITVAIAITVPANQGQLVRTRRDQRLAGSRVDGNVLHPMVQRRVRTRVRRAQSG
ncbi:hypothetical protein [Actinoallomurus sp. NPDC050550]|uniref:hypothetical protein n=1 Tax=Actinoallomurus sp. NPDC050550 TaxID=3154937 RepID=UPI0033E0789C